MDIADSTYLMNRSFFSYLVARWNFWETSVQAPPTRPTWRVEGAKAHLQEQVVLQELLGEPPDLRGEGGGEHEGLAVAPPGHAGVLHHPPDVRHEAHVQHPVRLVQHEELDGVELDVAALGEVEEPAGRGHQHVAALGAQVVGLVPGAGAAVEDAGARRRAHRELACLVVDLDGELPGGRHDDGGGRLSGPAAAGVGAGLDDVMQDGQQEGGRLAGAGLGAGHEVPAGLDDGQPVPLHRRGHGVSGAPHRLQQRRRQPGATEVAHRRRLVLARHLHRDVVVLGEVDAGADLGVPELLHAHLPRGVHLGGPRHLAALLTGPGGRRA